MLGAKKATGLYGSRDKVKQKWVYEYGSWLKINYILFKLLNYYKNYILKNIKPTRLYKTSK